MEQLYHTLDAYFAPGILMGLALCLFFLHIPAKAALRNYRLARYVMASAYLLYAVSIYLEYLVLSPDADAFIEKPIILFVACFQAYLFTHTLITLIHISHIGRHKLLVELAIIFSISIGLFLTYLTNPSGAGGWAFWGFAAFYLVLLVRFVMMFEGEYKHYNQQMDNYFSDEDTRRLRWVKRSFYLSLAVGVMALIYALSPSAEVGVLFISIVIVFYAVFAVRFINYALQFQSIETVITESDGVVSCDEKIDNELMARIDMLMTNDKLYRKSDLSVSDIAKRLEERPRMVSAVINACRQSNFKTYINEFRVEEAKRLIDEDKAGNRTIDAIASEAGFTNRSSFYRVFKRSQGISPTDYRLGMSR